LKRILFITRAAPYPTNFGGGQRSNLILQALRELGEVDLILIGRPSFLTDEHLQVLRDHYGMIAHGVPTRPMERGPWPMLSKLLGHVLVKRLSHNLDGSRSRLSRDPRLIARFGASFDTTQYDVVVGRYANALGNLGFPYDVPTVLDVDDLDTDVYTSKIALAKNVLSKLVLKWHRWNIARGLTHVLSGVNHAFVANPSNCNFPGLKNASVLPNIPFSTSDEVRPYVAPGAECKTVMVIGSYDYEPNVEGVDWLVERVWRSVVSEMPDAVLKIYGSNMSAAMRERWNSVSGVEAVGFADSLEEAYQSATLTVCPVLRGAGSNIKVIESAAYGRVCLLTEASARGYQDDPDLDGLLPVATSPAEMSANLLHFLNASDDLETASRCLYDVVQSKYSRAQFISIVKDAVSSHTKVGVND
jgi:polysaccharide biosynthesis protein PslH